MDDKSGNNGGWGASEGPGTIVGEAKAKIEPEKDECGGRGALTPVERMTTAHGEKVGRSSERLAWRRPDLGRKKCAPERAYTVLQARGEKSMEVTLEREGSRLYEEKEGNPGTISFRR